MENLSYTPEEPIAAIATALSPSALGIIRTSGKGSIENVAKIFSRPKALIEAQGNTIVYGWILDKENSDSKIDEVLVSVFRSPKSSTGEDMAEITCHGGPVVVTAIFNALLANGFRQAERGEFTFRGYINGKTDLTKAEAIKEIIDSRTDTSRSRAAGRLAGALFAEIDSVKKLIIDTLAAVEVEIEYPEDEETIADAYDTKDLEEAVKRLETLVKSWKTEKLYQDGVRVVLCGKTNAGKSSLFNALLKEERAIVSDIEGTTRDWIESWVSFDGVPARLFDTAGLRETDDVIEARGVEMTRELSSDADIILYLVDSSAGLTKDDEDFLLHAKESYDVPLILIWNKVDKLSSEQEKVKTDIVDEKSQVKICAKTGFGIEELSHLVKEKLSLLSTLDRGAALGSERQKNAVAQALESITHALEATRAGYALDAAVQDMEDALDFLGEVTGEVTSEDVLDSIFSHFCVGK